MILRQSYNFSLDFFVIFAEKFNMILLQYTVSTPSISLTFTEFLILVCAVLGIILFFKVWGACNDIKDIKRIAEQRAKEAEAKVRAEKSGEIR